MITALQKNYIAIWRRDLFSSLIFYSTCWLYISQTAYLPGNWICIGCQSPNNFPPKKRNRLISLPSDHTFGLVFPECLDKRSYWSYDILWNSMTIASRSPYHLSLKWGWKPACNTAYVADEHVNNQLQFLVSLVSKSPPPASTSLIHKSNKSNPSRQQLPYPQIKHFSPALSTWVYTRCPLTFQPTARKGQKPRVDPGPGSPRRPRKWWRPRRRPCRGRRRRPGSGRPSWGFLTGIFVWFGTVRELFIGEFWWFLVNWIGDDELGRCWWMILGNNLHH